MKNSGQLVPRIVDKNPTINTPESLPLKPHSQPIYAGWLHTSSKCGQNTVIDLFYCENLPPTNGAGLSLTRCDFDVALSSSCHLQASIPISNHITRCTSDVVMRQMHAA